jgi:hypothetical protein
MAILNNKRVKAMLLIVTSCSKPLLGDGSPYLDGKHQPIKYARLN